MATKKVFKKAGVITSIDEIINNKNKSTLIFMLVYSSHTYNISYNKLVIMSLYSIIQLIENKKLYYAFVVEEEIIRKTKTKVVPKQKSNITGCKTTLDKIYGED